MYYLEFILITGNKNPGQELLTIWVCFGHVKGNPEAAVCASAVARGCHPILSPYIFTSQMLIGWLFSHACQKTAELICSKLRDVFVFCIYSSFSKTMNHW